MAKKQSNTSENSAALQGAKPGMFIPIPTAEITNAAETARLRAEREAKEKTDKKAADAVVALISAIGVVEYTDACLKKINAAKQAYIQLTPDQKLLVENADVITTSEKEYDKLKIAAEKEAKEKADKKAADAVVVLISAIGTVEYTDACLKKIEAAKQAYNQLTQEQKSLVENGDVFIASVIKYKELEVAAAKVEEARKKAEKEAETARKKAEKDAKEKADKKAADAVVALIRAIGVVEYTDACLKKINAAKIEYSKLTADQKKLVGNADVIAASEKEYDRLKIAVEKEAEIARKKAEKEAEIARIRAKREAEIARIRAEREAKEKAHKKTADAVVALISAIGVVEFTDACLEKIYAAKIEYSKLTAYQKKLVGNADVITASEKEYDKLKNAAEKEAEIARIRVERKAKEKEAKEKADKKAAADVTTMISAIGTVKYTAACLKKIEAAKQAYVQLTPDQKLLVEDASVILASKKEYERLKIAAEEKEARKKEAERKKKRNIILIIASLLLISILYILFAGIEGGDAHSESKVLKELNTTDNSSVVSRHNHYNENLEQKRKEAEQEKAKITNYKRNIVYAKSAEELLNIYNAIQQEDISKDSAQVLLGLAAEMLYFCYKDGVGGVSQNRSAAINWLEKAANHGNPDAMEIIGYAYLYQLGYYSSECSLDPKKAYYWLEKAIKLNPDNEDLKKAHNKAKKIVSVMNKYGNAKMSWKIERRGSYPCNDRYLILDVYKKEKYGDMEHEYYSTVLEEKLYYSGDSGTWLY